MLEALETPRVEGGVEGTEGILRGVVEEGGGGVGSWASIAGTTLTSSLLESLLLLVGGSELFRKSKSKSSSTSCSLFLGLTKPEGILAGLEKLLPELEGAVLTLAVPASKDTLDFLMLPAAAEI